MLIIRTVTINVNDHHSYVTEITCDVDETANHTEYIVLMVTIRFGGNLLGYGTEITHAT
jgi:hypothetical protein